MRGTWRLLCGVAGVAIALVAPAAAHAAAADAVVMFSDPGDYIGGGAVRLYTPANGTISVSGSTADLTVGVSGGTNGDSFGLEFAAPYGQSLAPGVYDRAQRAPFREAGRPGIDIGGDGRGCNTIEGRFEVKDIAVTPEGVLQRLWIVYEQHCEGGTAALFGEVRLGEPGPAGPGGVAPAIVRWPVSDVGKPSTVVPATIIATAPMQVTGASLGGDSPGDFAIRLDECSGRSLVAGQSCQVWVRYQPGVAGTRLATLHVGDSGGSDYPIDLQGFSYGGTTRLTMTSDSGDYIGQGKTWSYTPANATISAGGSRRVIGFGIDSATGDWWNGTFAAGDGDILAAGSTYAATRYPFNGSGAGIDISGNGRGCNTITGTFTVTEANFEQDGRLHSFGATFEQHCEGGAPALRGTFEYRKGDTTQPAPWMVSGPGSTAPPTTFGSLAPGAGSTPPPSPPTATSPAPGTGGVAGQKRSSRQSGCGLVRYSKLPMRRGTNRSDKLRGTRRAERIAGLRGADVILGLGGSDCIDGGSGNDTLSGGAGKDRLVGGAGNDRLIGGPGRDVLDCGSGRKDVAFVTPGDVVRGCERKLKANRT
jgi:hypothetical protein